MLHKAYGQFVILHTAYRHFVIFALSVRAFCNFARSVRTVCNFAPSVRTRTVCVYCKDDNNMNVSAILHRAQCKLSKYNRFSMNRSASGFEVCKLECGS